MPALDTSRRPVTSWHPAAGNPAASPQRSRVTLHAHRSDAARPDGQRLRHTRDLQQHVAEPGLLPRRRAHRQPFLELRQRRSSSTHVASITTHHPNAPRLANGAAWRSARDEQLPGLRQLHLRNFTRATARHRPLRPEQQRQSPATCHLQPVSTRGWAARRRRVHRRRAAAERGPHARLGQLIVNANLIQATSRAGHGGVRLENINARMCGEPRANWADRTLVQVTLTNNVIANNVAGWSGAGLSLSDAVRGRDQQHHRPQRQHGHRRQRFQHESHPPDPNVSAKTLPALPRAAQPGARCGLPDQRPDGPSASSRIPCFQQLIWRTGPSNTWRNGWRASSGAHAGQHRRVRPGSLLLDLGVLDPAFQLRPTFLLTS